MLYAHVVILCDWTKCCVPLKIKQTEQHSCALMALLGISAILIMLKPVRIRVTFLGLVSILGNMMMRSLISLFIRSYSQEMLNLALALRGKTASIAL